MDGTRRGIVLPTVLFFVMVIYFLITVQVAQNIQNLSLTQREVAQTRLRYVARAAVNEGLARLETDPAFESAHPLATPWTTKEGGVFAQCWLESVPDRAELLYMRGLAYPEGRPDLSERSLAVVRKRPELVGQILTSGTLAKNTPMSLFRSTTANPSWELLPPAQKAYYDKSGTLHQVPGEICDLVTFLCADQKGGLFMQYTNFDNTGPAAMVQQMLLDSVLGNNPRQADMIDKLEGIVDAFGTMIASQSRLQTTIFTYDSKSSQWNPLPPVPEIVYDASGQPSATGKYAFAGIPGAMSSDDKALYVLGTHKGADVLYRYDRETSAWGGVPAPPKTYYSNGAPQTESGHPENVLGVATTGNGDIYATWGDSFTSKVGIFHYDKSTGWDLLPPLPPSSSGQKLTPGQLSSYPKGDLFVACTTGSGSSRRDVLMKYSEGAWSEIPSAPTAYYSNSGTLADSAQPAPADFCGVDGEGRALQKFAIDGAPDTVYRRDNDTALPPLPNKGYDSAGQAIEKDGFIDLQGPIEGGGYPTGKVQLQIVSTY